MTANANVGYLKYAKVLIISMWQILSKDRMIAVNAMQKIQNLLSKNHWVMSGLVCLCHLGHVLKLITCYNAIFLLHWLCQAKTSIQKGWGAAPQSNAPQRIELEFWNHVGLPPSTTVVHLSSGNVPRFVNLCQKHLPPLSNFGWGFRGSLSSASTCFQLPQPVGWIWMRSKRSLETNFLYIWTI